MANDEAEPMPIQDVPPEVWQEFMASLDAEMDQWGKEVLDYMSAQGPRDDMTDEEWYEARRAQKDGKS